MLKLVTVKLRREIGIIYCEEGNLLELYCESKINEILFLKMKILKRPLLLECRGGIILQVGLVPNKNCDVGQGQIFRPLI